MAWLLGITLAPSVLKFVADWKEDFCPVPDGGFRVVEVTYYEHLGIDKVLVDVSDLVNETLLSLLIHCVYISCDKEGPIIPTANLDRAG